MSTPTLIANPTLPARPATPGAPGASRPGLVRALRADRRRWHDGPTPVSLADLGAITRELAAQVRAGEHEVHVDTAHRWSRRLHADAHLDVWLISWATDQAAELHDHGGSLGALTVVRGELTEWRWSPGEAGDDAVSPEELAGRGPGLRRRVIAPGRGASFPLGHVHDVSNRRAEAAVSVHAYSPPLSAMSYYGVAGGVLSRTRSELVEPGEPPE